MTPEILRWVESVVTPADVAGVDVLEAGAGNVNGSVRPYIESLGPRSYIGTDRLPGAGVDEVLPAEQLVERYGPDRFGLVVSTEMIEHAVDWRGAVWAMQAVTAPGGLMVVTTRSEPFPYHGWPDDHWRYAASDMAWIWWGWQIDELRMDPQNPGIFLRAHKPARWVAATARARLERLTLAAAPLPRENVPLPGGGG